MVDRQAAWELLCEWTKNENLRRHNLAAEAAMRAYARKYGEDEEKWGIAGLLHDFDYERYPTLDEHGVEGPKELEKLGYPEDIVYAIRAHNDKMGPPRKTNMDKALFACDELTGFIVAVALVRPDKKISSVKLKSVTKRFKEKSFARGVIREDIFTGVDELGVEMNEHVQLVLDAMTGISDDLGL